MDAKTSTSYTLKIIKPDSFELKKFSYKKDLISWLLLNDFLPLDDEKKLWKHLYKELLANILDQF